MEYILDGNCFKSREETYQYISKELNFPDYFGNNLDALWDILSFERDLEIKIINGRDIVRNLGEYGIKILDVFGDLQNLEGNKITILW